MHHKSNFVREFVLRNRNLYKEDVILKRERSEPLEWCRELEKQIKDLKKKFPSLYIDKGYVEKRKSEKSPFGLARVAIPKMSFLARHNHIESPYIDIGVLMEHVASLLTEDLSGAFTHYRKGQLGNDRIQVIKSLADKRKVFEESIQGDILILDVDTGTNYAGWTPRRAREDIILRENFVALSCVDLAWIILLNPKRFSKNTDLSVDSVMEEYFSTDRGWVTNLFYYYRGGKLECGYRWNRRAYFDCGAGYFLSYC